MKERTNRKKEQIKKEEGLRFITPTDNHGVS